MALSRKNAPDDLNGTVPSLCKELWAIRRHTRRADPFIGLTTLADAKYVFCLAPCFGTESEENLMCYGCHWDDSEAVPKFEKKELVGIYGEGNVVFVVTPMKQGKPDYDGKSHTRLVEWG